MAVMASQDLRYRRLTHGAHHPIIWNEVLLDQSWDDDDQHELYGADYVECQSGSDLQTSVGATAQSTCNVADNTKRTQSRAEQSRAETKPNQSESACGSMRQSQPHANLTHNQPCAPPHVWTCRQTEGVWRQVVPDVRVARNKPTHGSRVGCAFATLLLC